MNEKVIKLTEEMDIKSRVIHQYILRDHQAKLQPDAKPRNFQAYFE